MIDAGADALWVNNMGDNLLHTLLSPSNAAVSKGQVVVMEMLLQKGVPPTPKNNAGRTPLHMMCRHHTSNLIEVLQSDIGAGVNVGDNDGIRPIHLAATISEQLVSQLIQSGADARVVTHECMNLLHIAGKLRQSNTVGLLLDYFTATDGLDLLDASDDFGRTPLHYACRSGRPETVLLLLSVGADPKTLDKKNLTPMHACAEFEEENSLWPLVGESPRRACGILTSDRSRPNPNGNANHFRDGDTIWKDALPGHRTARIREIIRLLIDYGGEIAFSGHITCPID